MRKLILLTFLTSALAFGQQQNVKISNLKTTTENFNFPLIAYPAKPNVENKINQYLQVHDLERIVNIDKLKTEKVTAENKPQDVSYLSWKKLDAPKNILSIEIKGENKGPSGELFTEWKNFDLRTGNYINTTDILAENSFKEIKEKVNNDVKEIINNYINELKSINDLSPEQKEQIRLYNECITYIEESSTSFEKMYFDKNGLILVKNRCASNSMLHLDKLGDFKITIPYNDADPYLSLFGKNILSKSTKPISQNTIQNKLYRGFLNSKYPITLLFKNLNEDGSITGIYWYNTILKPIHLKGSLHNNQLILTEEDSYNMDEDEWSSSAKIEATVKGKKIMGTRQDQTTKKVLTIELLEL